MNGNGNMPGEKVYCHRTSFTKQCRALVASGKCNRWISVRLTNAQTGTDVDQFDCVDNWTPFLLTNLGKLGAETTASVDKMHNFMSGVVGHGPQQQQLEHKQ